MYKYYPKLYFKVGLFFLVVSLFLTIILAWLKGSHFETSSIFFYMLLTLLLSLWILTVCLCLFVIDFSVGLNKNGLKTIEVTMSLVVFTIVTSFLVNQPLFNNILTILLLGLEQNTFKVLFNSGEKISKEITDFLSGVKVIWIIFYAALKIMTPWLPWFLSLFNGDMSGFVLGYVAFGLATVYTLGICFFVLKLFLRQFIKRDRQLKSFIRKMNEFFRITLNK